MILRDFDLNSELTTVYPYNNCEGHCIFNTNSYNKNNIHIVSLLMPRKSAKLLAEEK